MLVPSSATIGLTLSVHNSQEGRHPWAIRPLIWPLCTLGVRANQEEADSRAKVAVMYAERARQGRDTLAESEEAAG